MLLVWRGAHLTQTKLRPRVVLNVRARNLDFWGRQWGAIGGLEQRKNPSVTVN